MVAFCHPNHRMEMLTDLAKIAKSEYEFEIYKQIDIVQKRIEDVSKIPAMNVWADVLSAVSLVTLIPQEDITDGKTNEANYVRARHIAIWSMRKLYPKFSQQKLGDKFKYKKAYCTIGHVENKTFVKKYSVEKAFRAVADQVFEILTNMGYPIMDHVSKIKIIV